MGSFSGLGFVKWDLMRRPTGEGHSLRSEQSQQINARCLEHPKCSKYLILIRVLCSDTKAHLAWEQMRVIEINLAPALSSSSS